MATMPALLTLSQWLTACACSSAASYNTHTHNVKMALNLGTLGQFGFYGAQDVSYDLSMDERSQEESSQYCSVDYFHMHCTPELQVKL